MVIKSRGVPPVVGLTTSKSRTFFALTLLFYVLALIWVGLRIYARRLKRKSLRIDDYMIFAGLVFQMLSVIFSKLTKLQIFYTGQTICTLIRRCGL